MHDSKAEGKMKRRRNRKFIRAGYIRNNKEYKWLKIYNAGQVRQGVSSACVVCRTRCQFELSKPDPLKHYVRAVAFAVLAIRFSLSRSASMCWINSPSSRFSDSVSRSLLDALLGDVAGRLEVADVDGLAGTAGEAVGRGGVTERES